MIKFHTIFYDANVTLAYLRLIEIKSCSVIFHINDFEVKLKKRKEKRIETPHERQPESRVKAFEPLEFGR